MTSSTLAGSTVWTEARIITTKMLPAKQQYEYANLYARGTGARNHMSSLVRIDTNVLLDHAVQRGLYLIVLDRFTL